MSDDIIIVREAVLGDAETIFRFNQSLALETENRHLPDETLRNGIRAALLEKNRLAYWMACKSGDDPSMMGQIAVSYEWSDWRNGWIWWLQSVYVDQPFRKQGVFRSLLNHVNTVARTSQDVIGLRLYVEHENTPAIMTYTKLGFERSGYHVMELMWLDKTQKKKNDSLA
ncbi:MAG: hypothetical protein RJA81_1685 [Planctomycetota bacterium]